MNDDQGLLCRIRVSKGAFMNLEGRLHKMFPCAWLRNMDFLNIPVMLSITDATARNSPSGLNAGFSGHPCPEIAGYLGGILRKSNIPSQGTS